MGMTNYQHKLNAARESGVRPLAQTHIAKSATVRELYRMGKVSVALAVSHGATTEDHVAALNLARKMHRVRALTAEIKSVIGV
jgi:hypothetical protein